MRNLLTAGLLAGMLALPVARAQEGLSEQHKLMAKRSAEADAYLKLAETVYGLQINSRTYVKDFITESDEIRTAVDAFVKGVRFGEPTWYPDGSCEIPAEVTVAKVVECLRQAHTRHYRGDSVEEADFDALQRRLNKNVIRVIGMGAARPDLPPRLPEAALERLGPAPAEAVPGIPELWTRVGAVARLSAMRAARRDAQRRLAERIKGLRLTARTQVRDFVAESDEITTELQAFLVNAQERGGRQAYYLHDDELIAECTLVVPTEQVVETVKALYSRHRDGDDLKGADIEQIVRTIVQRDFTATGMGIPNPRMIRKYLQESGAWLPDWSLKPLEADGQGTDPEFDTPLGKLRAARSAELDARRRLAERILALPLENRGTVQDFAAGNEELAGRLQAVVVDAIVTRTRFADGRAVVTLSLPGMRVWDILDDAWRKNP